MASIVFGFVLAGEGAFYCYRHPLSHNEAKNIVIPAGDTDRVIKTLVAEKLLPDTRLTPLIFKAAVFFTRREGVLHAAELAFPAHVSIKEILHILRHGKPVLHEITIPEGLSAAHITALLNAAPFLLGKIEPIQEADILPQTYGYTYHMQRKTLLDKMKKAKIHAVARLWSERDAGLPLHTAEEMVTLASIVEKETAIPAERPEIARVFFNRLRLGMKLQSDPTVIYAITQGKYPLGRALIHNDLAFASPYNTYIVAGLPPHPICAPGLDSLQAVAHPAKGDMLYFVGNGQGGHNFASTLQEHNRNVLKLREVSSQKNKKDAQK